MVNNRMAALAKTLLELNDKLDEVKAMAGFDGFIDIITRPIASGDSRSPTEFHNEIKSFSKFLANRAGNSSSIELAEYDRKLGGNAPIFSNALGCLGVSVTCIGAFGYPEAEKVFQEISPNCNIIPVAMPGTCTALEFDDGKIMLALNGEINSMTWELISQRAGIERLIKEFRSAQLVGLFNWSETPMASDIWKGILQEVLPYIDNKKRFVFDFSDCVRRRTNEIADMLNIIAEFGRRVPVTVSLNENEEKAVSAALGLGSSLEPCECGQLIRQRLSAEYVVLHFYDYSMGFSKDETVMFKTCKVKDPVITTGAGDNFNAGLSFGLLLGLPLADSIMVASMTSSYYVGHGKSPKLTELADYITEYANTLEEAIEWI